MNEIVEKVGGWGIAIIGIIALVLIFFVGFTYLTMIAWNILMPVVFHLPKITFWQAWAVTFLLNIGRTINFKK